MDGMMHAWGWNLPSAKEPLQRTDHEENGARPGARIADSGSPTTHIGNVTIWSRARNHTSHSRLRIVTLYRDPSVLGGLLPDVKIRSYTVPI
jgi:hypothetical protein